MILHPTPKINIGLNVLGKRPDGYHNLETLFYPYRALSDTLTIEPADGTCLEISIGDASWDAQDDLCAKAWRLLRDRCNIPGVRITLEKHIPVGAGLGGGSADAVATLKGLDEMFSLNLSRANLLEMSALLGSDCPFFVYDEPCFGSGRGEVLEPFDVDLEGCEIRLEMPPGESVSTAAAYSGLVQTKPVMPLRDALELPLEQWQGKVVNDFEASVFPAHPAIAALKKRFLEEGAVFASMTGSGAAVFGIFKK